MRICTYDRKNKNMIKFHLDYICQYCNIFKTQQQDNFKIHTYTDKIYKKSVRCYFKYSGLIYKKLRMRLPHCQFGWVEMRDLEMD